MLKLALVLFLLAVLTGFLGLYQLAGTLSVAARLAFLAFLAMVVVALALEALRRARS